MIVPLSCEYYEQIAERSFTDGGAGYAAIPSGVLPQKQPQKVHATSVVCMLSPELEFDGSETSNLTHRRLWGPLVDQLIASEEVDSLTTPGDVLWALFDQVGTIRDIGQFDPNAGTAGEYEIVSHRVYNSFGVLTDEYDPDTQSPSNVELDFGFTGKFTDELTGLTHHQHRWLDPQLGKWINEDPIGLAGGDVNTTRYVANDPLMYSDPTGLFASNMGSFGGANGSSGHGGGDGDGIKAYEGYDDEVPALFRFIHWCLGTTPDSIKSKNRAEHGRVCLELSKPDGDPRVNQSTFDSITRRKCS